MFKIRVGQWPLSGLDSRDDIPVFTGESPTMAEAYRQGVAHSRKRPGEFVLIAASDGEILKAFVYDGRVFRRKHCWERGHNYLG